MAKEKKETSISKAVRAKTSTWIKLQELADQDELGNLNHYINKILESHVKNNSKKSHGK